MEFLRPTSSSFGNGNETLELEPKAKIVETREARPRRSIVKDFRYHGHDVDEFAMDCDYFPVADNSSSSSSSEDEDEQENKNDGDVDADQAAWNEYLDNRTEEENMAYKKLKEEQKSTQERLSRLNQRSRDQFRSRDYDVECYFDAILRPKSKKDVDPSKLKKTVPTPKKPRKGNRTGRTPNDKLPEKPVSTFSVSKAIRNLDSDLTVTMSPEQEVMINNRREEIKKNFPEWMFLLRERFNIIIHGYGSKRDVFEDFQAFVNDNYFVIGINGLYPKKHYVRKFLVELCRVLRVKIKLTGINSEILAEEVRKEIEKTGCSRRVFFLIRNVELLAIKNPSLFEAISVLVQIKRFHLIASCDHVNSFAGVDQATMISLNLYWIQCPTFAPYEDELDHLPGVLGEEPDRMNSKNSIEHIFKSLTTNSKRAFAALANLQLSAAAAAHPSSSKGSKAKRDAPGTVKGVQFQELARRCKESFIAHSDQTLKTLLQEFFDHKLISFTGNKSSIDTLTISMDLDVLEEFLRNHNL